MLSVDAFKDFEAVLPSWVNKGYTDGYTLIKENPSELSGKYSELMSYTTENLKDPMYAELRGQCIGIAFAVIEKDNGDHLYQAFNLLERADVLRYPPIRKTLLSLLAAKKREVSYSRAREVVLKNLPELRAFIDQMIRMEESREMQKGFKLEYNLIRKDKISDSSEFTRLISLSSTEVKYPLFKGQTIGYALGMFKKGQKYFPDKLDIYINNGMTLLCHHHIAERPLATYFSKRIKEPLKASLVQRLKRNKMITPLVIKIFFK